jgi:N6-L-threonylcarbamoyladenine synthase
MKKTIILGTETSCDDTSASIVENGKNILSSVVSSQVDFHRKYGGVVPEIASRKHLELINLVYKEALEQAGLIWKDIDSVAVTKGPGLIGALMVGMTAAKAVALSLNIPLVSVNHLEGHIYSVFLHNKQLKPPILCLIVSGGHTSLVIVEKEGSYKEVGRTLDDAAGEAYDKVAKVLGLGYPGGPYIEETAKKGNRESIKLPRAIPEKGNYNFSFSGLKTAVIYYLRDNPNAKKEDVAASFEEAVVDVLTKKAINAAKEFGLNKIAIAGGVSANMYLVKNLQKKASENDLQFFCPSKHLATDNAAMIAGAAFYKFKQGKVSGFNETSVAGLTFT